MSSGMIRHFCKHLAPRQLASLNFVLFRPCSSISYFPLQLSSGNERDHAHQVDCTRVRVLLAPCNSVFPSSGGCQNRWAVSTRHERSQLYP